MNAVQVAIIDYGIGNLRSVQKALQAVGAQAILTSSPAEILAAAKIVLPGVGAFGKGMTGLAQRRLVEPLLQACRRSTPLLGICLGMQLLFESSQEAPGVPGLGLLPGEVRRFDSQSALHLPGALHLKVPQTGWNQLEPLAASPLLHGLPPASYAYFNHAYYCVPAVESHTLAATQYTLRYASVVGDGSLYGVQFHPEKSQAVGLQILRNFVELC